MDIILNLLTPQRGSPIRPGDFLSAYTGIIGDVNGDGFYDRIIGNNNDDTSARNAGAAYVVYGISGGRTELDLNTITAAERFNIFGEGSFDYAGSSASIAGDVNGDGLDDLIITSSAGDRGVTYLVYGRSDERSDLFLSNLTETDGFRLIGSLTASGAGDVNGDGFDDVIVGLPGYGSISLGKAYVVYGSSGVRSDIDLPDLTAAEGFSIRGIRLSGALGTRVRTHCGSQKMTVAAMQMADMKVWAHRS